MSEQYPYKEKYCKGCKYHSLVPDWGKRDKWLCFGITTPEYRKAEGILDSDKFRFCVRGDFEPISRFFVLNMTEEEARKIVEKLQEIIERPDS